MDLDDSFTDKLIKRTKARRDYLKGKIADSPIRMKRTALVEEQQIPNEDDQGRKESPKRLCTEQTASEHEVQEDDSMEETKENVLIKERETNPKYMKEEEPMEEEEVPYRPRGLAALRKKHSAQDDMNDQKPPQNIQKVDKPTYVFSTNTTDLCSSRKNRLASLAANINGWEDNLKRSTVPSTTSSKGAPTRSANQVNKVTEFVKTAEQKTWNNVKQMGKEVEKQKPVVSREKVFQPKFRAKEVEDTLNRSFEPSNLPLSARKALFEQAAVENKTQSVKPGFEPKLSVAQRAALFENAPKPKFGSRPVSQKPANSSPVKQVQKVDSPVKLSSAVGCQSPAKPSNPLNGSPAKPAAVFKMSPAKLSAVLTGSPVKPSSILTQSPAKPSAASTGSPAKHIGSPALSHNSPINPQITGGRNATPTKSSIPTPPAEPPMSPSQQQWAKRNVVEPEKQRPLSNLVNHWEKLSSTSSVPNSQSEEEVPTNAHPAEEHDSYSSEEEQIEFEGEEEEQSESEPEEQVQSEIEEQAATECEESKSDSTPDEEESGDDDPFTDCSSFNSKSFAAAAGIETETENEDQYSVQDRYSANSVSDGSSCYPSQSLSSSSSETRDGSQSHQPLSYTVSFYRKQKQETRTPPLKTIVRREQVPPLSEEEQRRVIDIQEAIKRLQEECVVHQNVIGQTSQLINVCCTKPEFSGSSEEVEAERVLLTATQKRQACLNEIQRLKSHGAQGYLAEEGYGILTISNMELPLKRDFIAAQLEGKTNDVHFFLCLVRHGHQVIETQMMSTNEKITDGSLHFTNLIKLQNLPPDFSVVFEVYTMQTKKESISHDKKYGIRRDHSKIKLTPKGRKGDGKLPAVSSPGGPHAVRSPSFRVVGYTRFTLQNHSKKCFTLDKIPFTSPLEGVLKVKLHLHSEHNVTEKGFLTMFEDVSGFGAWHRRWCKLENHLLSYWKYPDEEDKKDPIGSIDLRQCITKEVGLVSRDICARRHTIELLEVRPKKKGDQDTLISHTHDTLTTTRRLLSADTKEERVMWCQRLNDALRYVRMWDPKALAPTQ